MPEDPAVPAEPVEPELPSIPEDPEDPAEPDDPVEPDEPVRPVEPDVPADPDEPSTPLSPVLANVIKRLVLFVIELIELETNSQLTVKNPVDEDKELIVNSKKSPGIPLLDTLKCPLIVLDESSMVCKKSLIFLAS